MNINYIETRLAALREKMQEAGLEALFLLNTANVRYLSGFTGEESYLLLGREKNIFITDSRYTEQAAAECQDYELCLYQGGSLATRILELCREQGIKTLGFEKEHLSYHLYSSIVDACGEEVCFTPVEGIVSHLRLCKDAGEIALLRHACACTDQVFSAICSFIQPGRTEKDVEWQLFSLFHELDCGSSFPPIVVSGPRGALPHGAASQKVLKNGEFLTMDFGCMYQGYRADMTRTVHIGAPDEQARRIYQIVLEAHQKAASAIRAGLPCQEIDQIARAHIAAHGYGENFGHSLGHGVGLDVHEGPALSPRSKGRLQAGNIVTVEPGIYIPGWGGIRIEDTVLVTETGAESLFTSSKELLCL